MDTPTILVIEDDAAVRRGVCDALTFSGYQVLSACDGREGLKVALSANYQLLLLDLVMPHLTGFEILEALRDKRPGQAVIVLSARGEENDRVRGLSLGADDYVVKPFSVRELLARVDAVLRRTQERPVAVEEYDFGDGTVDFSKREVSLSGGEKQDLSDREASLLSYLVMHRDRAVSREEILQQVWGLNPRHLETRAIDMHVARLRAKLGERGSEILVTVRGKGYRIETLVKEELS